MTVNNSANKVIAAGNGVQTVFNFGFIAVAASDLAVILTDSSGNETILALANYTVALNPTPPGQIWAIGGTVTYPLVGSPIPTGSTLTIVRELSLTQLVALGNQGNEFPSAVETALDILEMQLQQVNELFQRAIVAPVVDPTAPLPLPPAAQRANLGMGFDASGNPVAIALPASGAISSIMQPVVNAATLALGRAAFGLGTIAVEGIGAGLQDDGAGNVRVQSVINEVATNQAVHAANHTNIYAASGALTFTLDRASTLFEGFEITVYALTGAVTFVPNAADNFFGLASGTALVVPKGAAITLTTDAAASGAWFPNIAGVSPVINIQKFTASGTYTPSPGLLYAICEGVAAGGGGAGCTGASGGIASGGGAGAGETFRDVLSAALIGASQTVTIGIGGAAGGPGTAGAAGGNTSIGALLIAIGGAPGQPGNTSISGLPGAGGAGGTVQTTGGVLFAGNAGEGGLLAIISSITLPAGRGGDSRLGAGGPASFAGGVSGVNGANGVGYGGGGAGGQVHNSPTQANGGAGHNGLVIITEFLAFAA